MTRAREALEEARLLARNRHLRAAVSRAYYAAFYAARAAIRGLGSDAGTHRGVASEFSRLIVREGRVSPTDGRLLRQPLAARLEADYDDGDSLEAEAVRSLLDQTEAFVDAVEGGVDRPGEERFESWQTFSPDQKRVLVAQLRHEMEQASETLEFERAAALRDSVAQIEASLAA